VWRRRSRSFITRLRTPGPRCGVEWRRRRRGDREENAAEPYM